MSAARAKTPPPTSGGQSATTTAKPPLTPDQVRRIELSRLKAKAIRTQNEAQARSSGTPAMLKRTPSGFSIGQKRPAAAISASSIPSNRRDGRRDSNVENPGSMRMSTDIMPAQKFSKFVEYDFSRMTDTKGGFLTADDDPHNKALNAPAGEEKPAHMTLKEWERHQLLKKLRDQKAGPFEPGVSAFENKACQECKKLDIDANWDEVFGCQVCSSCKEKFPDKYSLLTKTEAKEDYLLTDPELKDVELLPHLERPNPHKSTWNNMMLYLRYQVEEYAFSKKWGSAEALDEEFAKREQEKKKRKEDKFRKGLQELKKRTRVEAHRRNRETGGKGGNGAFGDDLGRVGHHDHEWGRTVHDAATGMGTKTCIDCGMEVEELEF